MTLTILELRAVYEHAYEIARRRTLMVPQRVKPTAGGAERRALLNLASNLGEDALDAMKNGFDDATVIHARRAWSAALDAEAL